VAELSARTKARPNRVLFDSNLIHAARSAHVLAKAWNQFKQNAIRFFFLRFALRLRFALLGHARDALAGGWNSFELGSELVDLPFNPVQGLMVLACQVQP